MKAKHLYLLLTPLFGALYQLFTKLAADKLHGTDFSMEWVRQAAQIPWMWLALLSEVVAFVVWMRVLEHYDLGRAFLLSSITYILVLAAGHLVFNEVITPFQMFGSVLILVGVCLVGLPTSEPKAEAK